ncbi:MAG: hypothetical protein JWN60_317 [Acidobacteria bacterium]|jgi:hypothetical protein|nr:hypothetical protein [Acidobacteriota bacterium]
MINSYRLFEAKIPFVNVRITVNRFLVNFNFEVDAENIELS